MSWALVKYCWQAAFSENSMVIGVYSITRVAKDQSQTLLVEKTNFQAPNPK
jgi:hypothetical protein